MSGGDSPRYGVVFSDRAERDLESAYLYVSGRLGPERANAWALGLREAALGLAAFPGPLAHAADPEASARQGREVRRLLYRGGGPGRRRSAAATVYHVLYLVVPPAPGEADEGTVVVLSIRHAARGPEEGAGGGGVP